MKAWASSLWHSGHRQLPEGIFYRRADVGLFRPGARAGAESRSRTGDEEPGVAQTVAVEVGIVNGDKLEIVSGLSEQDQVVVQGKDLVKPGQKVCAVPATGGG